MTNPDFNDPTTDQPVEGVNEPVQAPVPVKKRRKMIYSGFGGFLLFMLAVAVFFFYNFKTVEVNGDSMKPTLDTGNKLLITRAYWLVGPIVPDDIVVIKNEQEEDLIIKRVYKIEGQEVDPKNAPYSYSLADGPYIVPKGTIYVLGDNYQFSQDSRDYGPFSLNDVIGKVVIVQSAIGKSASAESE